MSVCYAVTQPFVNHFFYVVIILLVEVKHCLGREWGVVAGS